MLSSQWDFTLDVRIRRPLVETLGHHNIGPNIIFETLELYISFIRLVVSVTSSLRVRPVVAVVVLCLSVRPVVRPVVVRPLSVLCPSIPLSVPLSSSVLCPSVPPSV